MAKTILITGASSGFGYLTTELFVNNGWNVIAFVKNHQSLLKSNIPSLLKNHTNLTVYEVNITKDDEINLAFKSITEKGSQIDVLVNNAGFGFLGPVETFSIEEVKEQYDVNIFGYLRMIKNIAPLMRKNNKGLIINISSVNGLVSFPLYGIYSSSKFAVETISEALNFELQPFNIRTAIIEPGAFATDFSSNTKFAENIKGSVYENWTTAFWKEIKGKAKKGFISKFTNPNIVSNLIFKIANSTNPRLRYKVGIDTHIYSILRHLVPYSIWQRGINLIYKWLK